MKLKIIALFVAVFASQAALANGQVVPAIENIPVADQDIPPGYVDMFVGGEEKPKIGKPAKDGANISYKHAENRDAMPARGDEGRVVYTFGESDPTVVCTPLRVCDIELEAGEVIVGEPQIGDGVRWKVSPAVHGSGASKTTHVIVKPTARNIETNLIIPTDRRVYHLRLAAVDDSARFTRYISFYYPDSAAKAWASYQSQVQKEETPVIDRPSVSVSISWILLTASKLILATVDLSQSAFLTMVKRPSFSCRRSCPPMRLRLSSSSGLTAKSNL